MSRPQSWQGMFALGLVLTVTVSLSGTVLAESSAVDSATDLLSRLLAGQSIAPEGYIPTFDTVVRCYDLVSWAYQASNATLDLTPFINAYVVPYLASNSAPLQNAARDFLASVVTLQEEPDTSLLQLIVDSKVSPQSNIESVRSYGSILNSLAQRFPDNPIIQNAVVQFLNAFGGDFGSLPPTLWDTVAALYETAYKLYPEDVVQKISAPQFPSTEPLTWAQRLTLQNIAQRLIVALGHRKPTLTLSTCAPSLKPGEAGGDPTGCGDAP